jgi:hypothetical protein
MKPGLLTVMLTTKSKGACSFKRCRAIVSGYFSNGAGGVSPHLRRGGRTTYQATNSIFASLSHLAAAKPAGLWAPRTFAAWAPELRPLLRFTHPSMSPCSNKRLRIAKVGW